MVAYFSEFSDFYCNKYKHYANAMMNGVYTGRIYTNADAHAYAETSWYTSYSTNNWYYGHE